jgi:hypothetical protein
MAKTKISEFSATPANNTDIDSINIAEGCAPSGINDAIRELMAQLKDFQTGAVGDSFNGPVGTSTAAAGAFTTLAASGAVTLSGGTANGVTYLNGSKVLTSGSALTFDGTALAVGTSTIGTNNRLTVDGGRLIVANGPTGSSSSATKGLQMYFDATNNQGYIFSTQSGVANYPLNVSSSTLSLASSLTTFTISGSEAMRLDSAGNLGLGVTPSAWDTGIALKAFQFSATGCVYGYSFGGNNFTAISNNFYINSSGTGTYLTTNTASQYSQSAGQHRWFTAASGTAGNAISFTQAMTLDASGNLGVGTTSPRSVGGYTSIGLNNTTGVLIDGFVGGTRTSGITTTASSMTVGTITSIPLTFLTADTERARIDSSGNLCIGRTSVYSTNAERLSVQATGNSPAILAINAAGSTDYSYVGWNSTTTGDNKFVGFFTEASPTLRGSIDYNRAGGVTRYNTSSDATLKNINGDAPKQISIDILNSTKIREYSWKDDATNKVQIGVIAQELHETFKGAVSVGGDKVTTDAEGNETTEYVPWAVDKTAFTFHLVAGWQEHERIIQEQQALIVSLKARLDAANL